MSNPTSPTNPGAALWSLEDGEERDGRPSTSRARARAIAADSLIDEAQAILDEHLDVDNPAAAATRAKNRAEFRWRKAAALARSVYGDAVQVESKVQLVAVTLPLSLMLPSATPSLDGASVVDARVEALRAGLDVQRALLPSTPTDRMGDGGAVVVTPTPTEGAAAATRGGGSTPPG